MAIAGIVFKMFVRERLEMLSTILYLLTGWIVLIAIKPLLAQLSPAGLAWLAAGGAAYTGGIIFFVWDRLPFNPAIWHLFVLAGSLCHFFAILNHVL